MSAFSATGRDKPLTTKPTLIAASPGHAPLYEVTNVDYNNDVLQLGNYVEEVIAGTNADKIPGAALTGALQLFNSTAAQIPLQVLAQNAASVDAMQVVAAANNHRWSVDKNGHEYHVQTTAPTLTAGTGMGTSPTSISVFGSDQSGRVAFTSGTACAAFANIFTLNFNQAYGTSPQAVVLMPFSSTSGAYNIISISSLTTTAFIGFSGGTGLTASTFYSWYYIVL